MDLREAVQRIIDHVGPERYERACRYAWGTAEGTGRSASLSDEMLNGDDVVMVPHDVHGALTGGGPSDPLPGADDVLRHRAVLEIYRHMPSYALLMFMPAVRSPEVLDVYGSAIREFLDHPDPRLADPASYHLWCGDFEGDDAISDWIWGVVTQDVRRHPRRLARLLDIAGPVPWRLKRELYRELAGDPEWKDAVRDSIAQARTDYFGQIDPEEAAQWS